MKGANVYFLIVAILASIPGITPISPMTSWAPLIFVLGIAILREGLEDYSRGKNDKELNASDCKIIYNNEIRNYKWKNLLVG